MARKLSGEATEEELSVLDHLLREEPHINYSKEILHDLWLSNPQPDSQYTEIRYKELVQQLKSMGIDEGKFTHNDHYINGEPEVKKAGSRKWLIALCSFAALAVITGGIFFYTNKTTPSKDLAEIHSQNEISTKNGSKTYLVLPDGTKVWLNSSSEMIYDKNYGNKIREVTLSGEAYFDVVKNADKPFVIHTAKMDIKVLGTAFNVKCYPGEKTTETSLIRGSIEVTLKDRQEKIMLKPNEKLVINNEEIKTEKILFPPGKTQQQQKTTLPKPIISLSHLTLFPADSTVVETAWVKNKLTFSSESFEDIALKMERWYGVKIKFTNEGLKMKRFTGTFEKEAVSEALNALQLSIPFSFSYALKYDTIIISKYNTSKK